MPATSGFSVSPQASLHSCLLHLCCSSFLVTMVRFSKPPSCCHGREKKNHLIFRHCRAAHGRFPVPRDFLSLISISFPPFLLSFCHGEPNPSALPHRVFSMLSYFFNIHVYHAWKGQKGGGTTEREEDGWEKGLMKMVGMAAAWPMSQSLGLSLKWLVHGPANPIFAVHEWPRCIPLTTISHDSPPLIFLPPLFHPQKFGAFSQKVN